MFYKRRNMEGIMYVGPVVIILFVFTIYPLVYSLYYSFFDISGWNVAGANFVGLSNYYKILTDSLFTNSLKFTALYTILALVIELPIGIVLAFLVNELAKTKPRLVKVLTIFILIPILFPGVATATMFRLMLNDLVGIIPYLVKLIFGTQISLVSSPLTATLVLLSVDVWQWTSFFFLLMYASFRSIPLEITEAAEIDGASKWRIIKNISVPISKFVIIVALVLRGIWLFRSFEVPRILTGGGPGTATRTVSMQIYQYTFNEGLLGKGGAATIMTIIVINIVAFLYFKFLNAERKG